MFLYYAYHYLNKYFQSMIQLLRAKKNAKALGMAFSTRMQSWMTHCTIEKLSLQFMYLTEVT